MFPLLHTDNEMIVPLHDVDEMIPHDVDDEMRQSTNLSRGFYAAFSTLPSVCDETPIEYEGQCDVLPRMKNEN